MVFSCPAPVIVTLRSFARTIFSAYVPAATRTMSK